MFKFIQDDLNKTKSSIGLGIFRILFGLIMLWEIYFFYKIDFLDNFILNTPVKFTYDFLPLQAFSSEVMELMLFGILVSTILITIGLFYRVAIIYFFLCFTYLFLLDKGYYNNHLYLISLISFLMIFLNMDAMFSVSKKRQSQEVGNWQYRILQFQIIVVYFFGGLAKINPYWFSMHPVEEILAAKEIHSKAVQYFIMIGGLLFDLAIGFLLLIPRTRRAALILALGFNFINAWVFDDINIFPFFMISTLVLFIDQETLKSFLKKKGVRLLLTNTAKPRSMNNIGFGLIGVFVLWQMILPLRHYFTPGYADWTGEDQRFAWRMKIQSRKIEELKFAVFDKRTKTIYPVDPKKYLNGSQYTEMAYHPRMIIQFAEFIKHEVALKNGIPDCFVKSKVKVAFNGCKSTYIFDPQIDLISTWEANKKINEWINPLPELED